MQNPTAWITELFSRHADDIHAYARWRVGDHEADDVVGEVFLVAWRSQDSVRPGEERAWLFGVARRIALARRRQNAARTALTDRLNSVHHRVAADGIAEQVVLSHRVRQALDQLTEADRELLVTAAWFDLAPSDAARVLAVSRPTYAVRLHRARNRFRAAFDQISAGLHADPRVAYPMSVREGA